MPDGMSRSRNVDRENGARAQRERSTRADCTANREFSGQFRLGAGLRSGCLRGESVANRTWSGLRSPAKPARWEVLGPPARWEVLGPPARWEVLGPPARQELIAAAAAAARDGVEPVLGGVPCLGRWLDMFDRHARTATAAPLFDKQGCNNELGARVAGTSVRSP
jgi:hypothetical protein